MKLLSGDAAVLGTMTGRVMTSDAGKPLFLAEAIRSATWALVCGR